MTRYLIRPFLVLLVLLSLPLTLGAQDFQNEDDIPFHLKRACFDNPKLHGAWFFNWEAFQNNETMKVYFEVHAIVDPAQEKVQKELLQELVDKIRLDPEQFEKTKIAAFHPLPLTDLKTSVRTQLKEELEDPGHLLEGAYYYFDWEQDDPTKEDNILRLFPYGRGKDADQVDRIRATVEDYTNNNEAWKTAIGLLLEKTDKMFFVVEETKLLPFRVSDPLAADLAALDRLKGANEKLDSVLVELAERRNHRGDVFSYDAYVVVDTENAEDQEVEVGRLLDQFPVEVEMVQVNQAPFTELVRRLNYEFEALEKFDGCSLSSISLVAGLVDDTYTVRMVLEGQLVEKNQQVDLDALVNEAININLQFDKVGHFGPLVATVDQMKMGWIDMDTALFAYNGGYYKFMEAVELQEEAKCLDAAKKPDEANPLRQQAHRSFEAANSFFDLAMISAPSIMEYRYWRILVLNELDRLQEAENHMRSLVRRDFDPFAFELACQSLEPVQRRRRTALRTLESRITVQLAVRGWQPRNKKPK